MLKRDGTDVVVGSDCYPTAGSWISPYDGVSVYSCTVYPLLQVLISTQVATNLPSDLDIDHIVPLKEVRTHICFDETHQVDPKQAWISGARDWTADQRESYANDLTRPQASSHDFLD